jgi:hypothetical protein
MKVSQQERDLLIEACRRVPPPTQVPAVGSDADYPDYITNLFLTVLDLQLQNVIVNNAILHYRGTRWDEIRTLTDLEAVLGQFTDDQAGNRAAAKYLWGYEYGDRLRRLRALVVWARARRLVDQASLREWAYESEFRRDFEGEIKGLGISAYCWLVMRLGVDTTKPDIWLHRFVQAALGRDLDDVALIDAITDAAHAAGRNVRELDAGIWESGRGGPGSI